MDEIGVPGHRPALYWIKTGMDLGKALDEITNALEDDLRKIGDEMRDDGESGAQIERHLRTLVYLVMNECHPEIMERLREAEQTDNGSSDMTHLVGYL